MEQYKTIYGFDIVTEPISYKPIISISNSSLSSSLSSSLENSLENSLQNSSKKTSVTLETLQQNYFIKYKKYSHPIAVKKK
jgi:hypothetical protein